MGTCIVDYQLVHWSQTSRFPFSKLCSEFLPGNVLSNAMPYGYKTRAGRIFSNATQENNFTPSDSGNCNLSSDGED